MTITYKDRVQWQEYGLEMEILNGDWDYKSVVCDNRAIFSRAHGCIYYDGRKIVKVSANNRNDNMDMYLSDGTIVRISSDDSNEKYCIMVK